MAKGFWSDEYTGERHVYGCTLRPALNGIPSDVSFVIDSLAADARFRHGTIDLTERMTPAREAQLDMVYLGVRGVSPEAIGASHPKGR